MSASVEVQDGSIMITVICDVTFLPSHNLELNIEIYNSNDVKNKNISDMCRDNKQKNVDFNHLGKDKEYNYSIVWRSSIDKSIKCSLESGHFKTKGEFLNINVLM